MVQQEWYKKRLLALGYPQGGSHSFDISNINHIQALVAWLEDTKIRLYKIEERAALRTMDHQWINTFKEYMKNLGSPHSDALKETNSAPAPALATPSATSSTPTTPTTSPSSSSSSSTSSTSSSTPTTSASASTEWIVLVDWLLAHAIGLEYRDNVESINEKAQKQLETKQTNKTPIDTSDYNSTQFKAALKELTALLNIAMHDDPAVLLNTIQKTVRSKFSKAALATVMVDNTNQPTTSSSSALHNDTSISALHSDTSISDDKFPLGFNTGESKTDVASTILRLLYIKDLRMLQTSINDLIVAGSVDGENCDYVTCCYDRESRSMKMATITTKTITTTTTTPTMPVCLRPRAVHAGDSASTSSCYG